MFESLKERLGSGGFREWLENNQSIVTIGAVVLLAIAVFVMIRSLSGPDIKDGPPIPMVYYYDVETEEVFEADSDQLPPITRSNGNEAVRAYYYTCGDCSGIDAEEMYVAYYEMFTEEGKAQQKAMTDALKNKTPLPSVRPDERKGQLVSRDAKRWVELYSPAGRAIHDNLGRCDPGDKLEFPEACGPDDVEEFLNPSDD